MILATETIRPMVQRHAATSLRVATRSPKSHDSHQRLESYHGDATNTLVVLAQLEPIGKPTTGVVQNAVGQYVSNGQPDSLPASSSSSYIRELYRAPLFTPEEERIAFRSLADLRQQAAELSTAIVDNPKKKLTEELEFVEASIVAIRNKIIEANLRLVVSVAKRFAAKGPLELADLISEGNGILMRAVDLFNGEYGTRFSTYATTALQRAFMHALKLSYRQQQRFSTGSQDSLSSIEDLSSLTPSITPVQAAHDTALLLSQLTGQERFIVERRFGLLPGEEPKTYRELGELLGLSKERIRQVLRKTLDKMRDTAERRRISPF